jgi:hypothetical protein
MESAMGPKTKATVRRRDFFHLLGAGAVTAACAAGLPAAETTLADTENNDEKRKPRYRESEEVKTFYRVNRYPS